MNNHFVIFRLITAVIIFVLLQTVTPASSQKLYYGHSHSPAVKSDSALFFLSGDGNAQLGKGNTGNTYYPIVVNGINTEKDAAGGQYHSIALKNNATIGECRSNISGQPISGRDMLHSSFH